MWTADVHLGCSAAQAIHQQIPPAGKTLKYFIMKRTVNQNKSVKAEGELSAIVGQFLGRLALDVTVSLICPTNNRARAIFGSNCWCEVAWEIHSALSFFFFSSLLLTFYVGGTASFSSVRLLLAFHKLIKTCPLKKGHLAVFPSLTIQNSVLGAILQFN